MRLWLVFAVAAWLVAPARADELEEAATRYDRGVELARRGDDLAALAEFEAAYALSRRWEVLYNIGVTEKRLFRYGRAVRTLERYLAEGGAKVDAKRKAEVEAELAEIRRLVATLTIVVDGAPARIEVDGLDEGMTPLPAPLLVAPGPHTVRALRDGEEPDEQTIELVSGQDAELRLAPKPAPVAVTTARVTVRTQPSGARLTIDDTPLGPAPWTGELSAGGHAVIAEHDGYVREVRELGVVAGQDRTITIELTALAVPPAPPVPYYKRRWVWGAAAAVVAGAAVTSYVLVTRPEGTDAVIHW